MEHKKKNDFFQLLSLKYIRETEIEMNFKELSEGRKNIELIFLKLDSQYCTWEFLQISLITLFLDNFFPFNLVENIKVQNAYIFEIIIEIHCFHHAHITLTYLFPKMIDYLKYRLSEQRRSSISLNNERCNVSSLDRLF